MTEPSPLTGEEFESQGDLGPCEQRPYGEGDTLEGSGALEGFELDVARLFAP